MKKIIASSLLIGIITLSSCQAPGMTEWILIFAVILLLFGGRKIPELMRGLGKGIREFNDAKQGLKDEFEKGMQEKEEKKDDKEKK
ncbi:MAG: twin-arginine translocase TatA/TatE family subunit [Chitinophagaceae bacterium]